jgi:hypothetical protein
VVKLAKIQWYGFSYGKLCGNSSVPGPSPIRNCLSGLELLLTLAAPPPTTLGEFRESLNIVFGISQIPQGTFQTGIIDIWLHSAKLLSDTGIAGHAPAAEPQSSPVQNVKPHETIHLYPHISSLQLNAI